MLIGGLLQRLMGDFPGLRWSLSALTVLHMGASGNTGLGADDDTADGAQFYPVLQQVRRHGRFCSDACAVWL